MNTLNCPDCQTPLSPITNSDVVIDVCPQCRGIWLDAGEFDLVLGQKLSSQIRESAILNPAISLEPRLCPRDSQDLRIADLGGAELDTCPTCRGIWVEAADLDALKDAPEPAPQETQPEEPQIRVERPPPQDLGTAICASCGEETPIQRSLKRMDSFWCEACVIEGDYPGGNGPPVQRRIKEAALARAKAEVRHTAAKNSRDARIDNADYHTYYRGHRVNTWAPEEYDLLFDRFRFWVRDVVDGFKGKKK